MTSLEEFKQHIAELKKLYKNTAKQDIKLKLLDLYEMVGKLDGTHRVVFKVDVQSIIMSQIKEVN